MKQAGAPRELAFQRALRCREVIFLERHYERINEQRHKMVALVAQLKYVYFLNCCLSETVLIY